MLEPKKEDGDGRIGVFFDSSFLAKQNKIPKEFLWTRDERPDALDELDAPVIDLQGFLNGDPASTQAAAEEIRAACLKHGFFQVINHDIDPSVLQDLFDALESFFKLPLDTKMKARRPRKCGFSAGFAVAHADRFSSNLPWKETFTIENTDVDFISSIASEGFDPAGWVYQRYSETMRKLTLSVFELLGISLGVDREYYREFFTNGSSLLRCNYYPPCQEPELALGTGPHSDPVALTVLSEDKGGGLEVLMEGKWHSVRLVPGALVVSIGDTFMALTNGICKSVVHRAMVMRETGRKSVAYFFGPRGDKLIRALPELVSEGGVRKYPDFTYSEIMEFTQTKHRANEDNLQAFFKWKSS